MPWERSHLYPSKISVNAYKSGVSIQIKKTSNEGRPIPTDYERPLNKQFIRLRNLRNISDKCISHAMEQLGKLE